MKNAIQIGRKSLEQRLVIVALSMFLLALISCGGDDDYALETSSAKHTVMFDGGNHSNITLYLNGQSNTMYGADAIREIKRQLDARIAECPQELQAAAKDIVWVIVNDFCFRWTSEENSGLAAGAYYPSMNMIKVSIYSGWRGNEIPAHNHAPHTLRTDGQMVSWSGGDSRYHMNKYYSGNVYSPTGQFPMGRLMTVVEHELKHVVSGNYHAEGNTAANNGKPSTKDIVDPEDGEHTTKHIFDEKEGAWGYFHAPFVINE